MARYENDGSIYVKNFNGIEVPADGRGKTIFAKAIPPYMVVEHAWIHLYIHGKDKMNPHAKQQIMVSGRMADMPADVTEAVNQSQLSTLDEYTYAFIPPGQGEERFTGYTTGSNTEGDAGDAQGIGLTGWGQPMSKWAEEREFFHYEENMGLGRNAIMTEANKIRFAAEHSTGSRGVKVSGHGCSADQFRLIAIDVRTGVLSNDVQQDVEKHVWGHSTADPADLMRAAYYFYGDQGAVPRHLYYHAGDSQNTWEDYLSTPGGADAGVDHVDAVDRDGNPGYAEGLIYDWANTGYGTSNDAGGQPDPDNEGSGLDESSQLTVQAEVTLRCKLIKRKQRNIYTPS